MQLDELPVQVSLDSSFLDRLFHKAKARASPKVQLLGH